MNAMNALYLRALTIESYDQMIGEGNDEGNAVVQHAIDALLDQTKSLERAVAVLDLKSIKFEGSDSLDSPGKVEAESKAARLEAGTSAEARRERREGRRYNITTRSVRNSGPKCRSLGGLQTMTIRQIALSDLARQLSSFSRLGSNG